MTFIRRTVPDSFTETDEFVYDRIRIAWFVRSDRGLILFGKFIQGRSA